LQGLWIVEAETYNPTKCILCAAVFVFLVPVHLPKEGGGGGIGVLCRMKSWEDGGA